MSTKTKNEHIWDADIYHSHSLIQFEAAVNLFNKLETSDFTSILDLGCGDGKITDLIAKKLPGASVTGIDASASMIDFALKQYNKTNNINLKFLIQDIENIEYVRKYDLVCSFFALQWISNLNSTFNKINKSLKYKGCFAFTIPLHISITLDQAIKKMLSEPKWSKYFDDFSPGWYFHEPKKILKLLEKNHFKPNCVKVIAQEMSFPSRQHLEKFILPWLTYLDRIPEQFKNDFFKQLIDYYLGEELALPNGATSYKYLRIEIISEKLENDPNCKE